MGYRVDYKPIRKIRRAEKRRASLPALTALFFLLFVILLNTAWPRGAEVMRRLVFSGDVAVTAAAVEDLAQDLKAGESFPEALEAFCRTVIRNGKPGPD